MFHNIGEWRVSDRGEVTGCRGSRGLMEARRLRKSLQAWGLLMSLIVACSVGQPTEQRETRGTTTGGAPTPQYTPDMFAKNIKEKPHFVMFYAPWCGHCKRLTATFEQLAEKYNVRLQGETALIARVDCTQHTALCSENNIVSYPTLLFFWRDTRVVRRYKGSRDMYSLDLFVSSMAQDGPTLQQVASPGDAPDVSARPYDLTDETFEAELSTGQHFVDFYAPWCGHCQHLAPVWDQLRAEYERDPVVCVQRLDSILGAAQVDCTRSTKFCAQYGIRGYPSLVYFSSGLKVQEYQGAREFDKLAEFVVEMKGREGERGGTEPLLETIPDDHGISAQPDLTVPGIVHELTEASFPSLAGVKGHQFVLFYAPWCPHCQTLAPTFLKVAEQFRSTPALSFAQLDCAQHQRVCGELQIKGYPTLILYFEGQLVDHYGGMRTLGAIEVYLQEKLRTSQLSPSTPASTTPADAHGEGALSLSREEFLLQVELGYTFINFYQPWCEHCQTLAPVWAELADRFNADGDVTIASVHCGVEDSLCRENQVAGYPMLVLYHAGARVATYTGARDLESLSQFLRTALASRMNSDSDGSHDEL